ncbi:ABC transporter permease subunit [Paenibacillus aurantius]|uniref:ABC transporter permease subunit n=1 Tax=Paenibacillus aurantius TaxID=2918900 RepID=A0AA96LHP7_9BACL|nr:ABC transporter permease subunit [Paenibacillus aurantius]WNQ13188.1 ABC transporter permease subunit [Paenibacillus aurantius]
MNGVVAGVEKQAAVKKGRHRKFKLKTMLSLYTLFAPTAILLFIFHYIPIYGIIIAFKKYSVYKGIMGSEWVGLAEFKYFLTDEKFWNVFRNTLILNVYDILFGFTAPIVFALLANELYSRVFKRVMQTVSYLPHFLSWIVVSGVFYSFLSPETGLFNQLIEWLGYQPVYFMTETSLFRGILVFADIWKGVGWSAILYFAVIAGIDSSLYEAAWIDGASRWRQAIHITIPHMAPMITLLFLLRLSSIFSVGFDRVFLLQNPLVYKVSDVISTYIYRIGLEQSQYSLSTAIGLTQSILGFVLLITANRISKKLSGMGLY